MYRNMHIALDFDGTIAKRESQDDLLTVGEPIIPMVQQVKRWIELGYKVSIFTARVSNHMKQGGVRTEEYKENQRQLITKFLLENGLPELPITADKSPQFTHFVDDKAVEVTKNEGNLSYLSFNRFDLI